jgi:hypothetical protein
MHRIRRVASAALLTIAVTAAGLAAMPAAQAGLPEAEPTEPPAAYTIDGVDFPDGCALQRLDLGSGTVTPLPAAPSPEACVIDLAVAPDGSVWGIGPAPTEGPFLPAFLTHFDADTGAVLSSTLFTGAFSEAQLRYGGLAFDSAGTLYAQLVTDEPGCDVDFVCLYTVDPSTAVATFVGTPGDDFAETFLAFLAADCGTAMETVVPAIIDDAATDASWDGPTAADHGADSLASYDAATGALTQGPELVDPNDFVVGLDYFRTDGTLYALIAPRLLPGEESVEATVDDVYASAFQVALYTVDPATAEVTLVAPLSDPEANIATLGIAGECPVPAPPPIVLEPTFTG